jgi:tetratricopeptide (TPR) repeat protein
MFRKGHALQKCNNPQVKRALLALTALLLCAAVGYAYTVTRRERQYARLVADGDYAMARGDTFAAVSSFSDAIALKPQSMLGYLKRGAAQRRRGDLETAAVDLERASALDSTEPRTFELLGDVESGRQSHDRAATHYAAAVRLDESPRLLYKLGLARYLGGHLQGAVDAATRAVALDSRFAEAHYVLGASFRELNKPREAEQALKRAITLSRALVPAREQLADLYDALGRRADRVAELEQLAAIDPSATRQVTLALAHAASGQTQRAVRQLRNASALYPNDPDVYIGLGRVWLDLALADDDHVALAKAAEALQYAVSMEPTNAGLAELGRARQVTEPAAAERMLRQATEKLPTHPSAFLHLADTAERTGHMQAARRALIDYRSLLAPTDGRQPGIAERVGDLSMRLGEPRTAVQWYRSASDGARTPPALLVRLAQAQIQAGDAAAARATVARILEKEPENAVARTLERRLSAVR